MPQNVYGPEADEEHAPVHDQSTPSGKPYDPRGHDVAANDPSDPRGDASRDNLDGRENQAGAPGDSSGDESEKAQPEGTGNEDTLGKGFTKGDKPRRLNFRKVLRRRNLLIAAPVAMIAGVLVFLLLIASSLKLPDIMQQITDYEFARATSQFAENSERVTDESLALEATNDSTWQAIKKNFTQVPGNLYANIRETTWGRLDAYRPNLVVQTLGEDHGLSFRYRTSKVTGRKILTDVYVEGEDDVLYRYAIPQVTSFAKWVPGLNSVLETKNNTLFLSKSQFLSTVNAHMEADEVSPIIRGVTANKIIGLAKGSRAGWVLSKFAGLDEDDSRVEASIQTYSATQAGATFSDNAKTTEISGATTAVSNATNTAVNDWQPSSCTGGYTVVAYSSSGPGYCSLSSTSTSSTAGSTSSSSSSSTSDLDQTITTGFDEDAQKAVQQSLDPNLLTSTLSLANPLLYNVVLPLCIVNDSSVQNSQPAIDNQMNQAENTFDQLNAEAGQQEKGDQPGDDPTELANAIGGTNAEIGETPQSIPYQRSEGEIVNTSNVQNVETGSGGSYAYSLINAIGVSGPTATIATYVANNFCKYATSTGAAVGLTAANIAAAGFSFGETEEGEQAAGEGASEFMSAFVKHIVSNIIPDKEITEGTTVITRSALTRARAFVWDQGLNIAKPFAYITSLAILAKTVIGSSSGANTNGLAQNSDIVNEADLGGNIEGNKIEQSQNFGRPLLPSEVVQANQQSAQYVDAQNASKSFADRYFALSNADSLVSHMALDLNGEMSSGIFNSILKIATMLFKPFNSIGSLLSLSGAVIAAPNPNTQDYGNVQFGWTQDEEKLINSDTSYTPLQNQHILDEDQNGTVENEIAQKYSMCFGYSYNASGNGDLDPTDPNGDLQLSNSDSLGNLLSTGSIARDSNGNVINVSSALCSPENLSYNSPDPLADNPWSTNGKTHDMIFRWRLAMAYDTTLDQLINEQSVVSP